MDTIKAQFIKADLHARNEHQHVECLRLKNLFVCMDKTNHLDAAHLVYDQDGFVDEIKRCGHTVVESELTLPLDEPTFNPLELACYETDQGVFFVFKDLAVWNNGYGLEVFCKAGMTLPDITEHWKLEDALDESALSYEYRVPNDQIGALAIKTEHLQYESWDALYRNPGERLESEERLEALSECYALLAGGGDLDDFIKQVEEDMREIIDLYSEEELASYSENRRSYCESLVEQAKDLLKSAYELRDESKRLSAGLNAGRNDNPGSEHDKHIGNDDGRDSP